MKLAETIARIQRDKLLWKIGNLDPQGRRYRGLPHQAIRPDHCPDPRKATKPPKIDDFTVQYRPSANSHWETVFTSPFRAECEAWLLANPTLKLRVRERVNIQPPSKHELAAYQAGPLHGTEFRHNRPGEDKLDYSAVLDTPHYRSVRLAFPEGLKPEPKIPACWCGKVEAHQHIDVVPA